MRFKRPFVSRKKYEAISMAKFALQLQGMQYKADLEKTQQKLREEELLVQHLEALVGRLRENSQALSARLDWNANQLLEMEKSVQSLDKVDSVRQAR